MAAAGFYIYGLFDPRDGQLRYVGIHDGKLAKRLNEHLCRARQGRRIYVYDWIRQLLTAGLMPEMEVLETCASQQEMVEAEPWHIAYWKSLGCRLTNLTTGGEGCWGYRHTAETRAKMSALKKGWKWPDDLRRRMQRVTDGQRQEMVARYDTGESAAAIAASYRLTGSGVRKILIQNGVTMRTPFAKTGTKRGPAPKLGPGQVQRARDLRVTGLSYSAIAKHFDVTEGTIRRVLRTSSASFSGVDHG